jgi:hypothetical protein
MIQPKDAHFGAKQQSFTHYSICCDNYWYLFIYDSIYYDDLIYNHMIYITHIKLLIIIDYNSSVGLYFYLRVITVFTVFRLLTDFVCLYTYEFSLSSIIITTYTIVSDWLLLSAKMDIFQLYHGDNKLHSMKWYLWWWCPLCIRPTRLIGSL